MNTLPDKRVLITGVSSGLGFGLAHHYLKNGWEVYGFSRRLPEALQKERDFHFATIDLLQFDTIAPGLDELTKSIKSLELLILNAGMLGEFGDMSEVPLTIMQRVMDVNLWANKVILDHFLQKKFPLQQVVAISSGASVSGSRGWNGYGISKAALNMLIKLYAKEMTDTHFCALAPGLVDSSMQEYLSGLDGGDTYPTLRRIQSTRNTADMPSPEIAAALLASSVRKIRASVKSGDFADIRRLNQS